MRTQFLMFLTAVLLIASKTPPKDAIKKDLKKLQGTWKVKSFGGDDKLQKEIIDKLPRIAMRGVKITALNADKGGGRFKIDPTKKPKAIDITPTDGPFRGQTFLAIYKVDGDMLKICQPAAPAKNRPKEFATIPEKQLLQVLKREKR